MEGSYFSKEQEKDGNFTKSEAFAGLLSRGGVLETNLPDSIKTSPELLTQCVERRKLLETLEDLYTQIPTGTTVENAIEENLLPVEKVVDFYTQITDMVTKDSASARLLLYFPFELLPDNTHPELQFFTDFYKSTWKELLSEVDLREDFNTGDVLERDLRNSPLARVAKATHLLPSLMERGIFSTDEIMGLLEKETDEVVVEGVLDTLRILAEKKYLEEKDIERLEHSSNINIKNTAKMLRYDQKTEREQSTLAAESTPKNIEEVSALLQQELASIEDNISNKDALTSDRLQWLVTTEKQRILQRHAETIYTHFSSLEDFESILTNKNVHEETIVATIKALEKKIVATKESTGYFKLLHTLENTESPQVRDQISATIARLGSMDLRTDPTDIVAEQGVQKIEQSTEKKIESTLHEIQNDPLLARTVYPVVMLYGSHMKGYAKEQSDLDMGVFIKEGSDVVQREAIKKSLADLVDKLDTSGSIMEFWLEKEHDALTIHNFEHDDVGLGNSAITSPLTGAWYGNKEIIQDLQKELLPSYLYSKDVSIEGFDARKIWLKNMEHNLIQYRLMHKGYEERNIKRDGIDSLYKDEIDGGSMFYDSGFRRLATKIYLEKVFLPQLEK